MNVRKIYFIHEDRVYHPSIPMNRDYYAGRFDVEEVSFTEAATRPDLGTSICWYMMGYYPKKLPAALTVHDYKSLSVPPLRHIKDAIKRWRNATPDIRIITPYIRSLGYFNDGVPTVLQDIGVPDYVPRLRHQNRTPLSVMHDFAYVGVLTQERKVELMLDSFIRRFGRSKTFQLIGRAEPWLQERYRHYQNIIFTGRVPQHEVFEYLLQTHVVVCYFPEHYPHRVQVPTKLLDAAALGCRILANEQVMNRKTAARFGIEALWASSNAIFDSLTGTLDWKDNSAVDPTPFLWSSIMRDCGLDDLIAQALKSRSVSAKVA